MAIECICALQAVQYRGIDKMSPQTKNFYEDARNIVPSITEDRIFSEDIERLTEWFKKNNRQWTAIRQREINMV